MYNACGSSNKSGSRVHGGPAKTSKGSYPREPRNPWGAPHEVRIRRRESRTTCTRRKCESSAVVSGDRFHACRSLVKNGPREIALVCRGPSRTLREREKSAAGKPSTFRKGTRGSETGVRNESATSTIRSSGYKVNVHRRKRRGSPPRNNGEDPRALALAEAWAERDAKRAPISVAGHQLADGAVLLVQDEHLPIRSGTEAQIGAGRGIFALFSILGLNQLEQRPGFTPVVEQNPADGILSAVGKVVRIEVKDFSAGQVTEKDVVL